MKNSHLLCAVISGPSFEEAQKQIECVQSSVDLLELRLDLLQILSLEQIQNLRKVNLPVVLTLRKAEQGGGYSGTEEQRLNQIRELLSLKPEYLDLECTVDGNFFMEVIGRSPTTKIICSYHNHDKTPDDIHAIYQEMCKKPASIYKIATMARSKEDAVRMLQFVEKQSKKMQRFVGVCLGELGVETRLRGASKGNAITYVSASTNASAQIAPGLMDLNEWQKCVLV